MNNSINSKFQTRMIEYPIFKELHNTNMTQTAHSDITHTTRVIDMFLNTIALLPSTTITAKRLIADIDREGDYLAAKKILVRSIKGKHAEQKRYEDKIEPLELVSKRFAGIMNEIQPAQRSSVVAYLRTHPKEVLQMALAFFDVIIEGIEKKRAIAIELRKKLSAAGLKVSDLRNTDGG
ncbi:hypothetical protein [Marinomonas flavescens]|uniref:hypothetical protein n=1 Tax=Marinomonas flavescens TaxID=2529379 RepID=UPI0010560B2E|nr:hypothetical protein [Marinomonas flavescens]